MQHVALALLIVLATSATPAAEPEQPTVRVAGVVLKWIRTDKEANFRRAEPMIRQAAANRARIVVTTECFLDGYAIADKSIPLEVYRGLGEPIPEGEYFRRLAALAAELKIHLVAGMMEADGPKRYNTAVLIGPGGKLLGKYRKQKLGHELGRNTPGESSPVFQTPYGRLGLMICADRTEKEIVARFRANGAEFLICPSGGMFGPKTNDPIVRARSRENQIHIVFVHPAEFLVTGPDGSILQRTILGDRLLVAPEEADGEKDRNRVFYVDLPLPAQDSEQPGSVEDAVAWLETQSKRMIRSCRRTMAGGIAAFPPQVGSHYNAFWLRDYAYMLEGCPEAFSDQELTDACLLFVDAQRADGACVDCVKYDGTPIYRPGYGSMGENPVADGSQFTVDVAWHTFRRVRDRKLVGRIIDRLVRAMEAVPRNAETGLVHITPGDAWDRCPYGFTDTVRKQGDVLFSSLLDVQAARQLADLLEVVDRAAEAREWRAEAERVVGSIRRVFWDAKLGLFRAATLRCKEPDVWGSAFAVYLGVASPEQSLAVARYFKEHYGEIVQCGQIRHLPGGMYWEQAGPRDRYQNGAFWATPAGWFVDTLDLVDPELADRAVLELVADFRRRGIIEWCFDDVTAVPDYLASGTLPPAGIRKMLRRRQARSKP